MLFVRLRQFDLPRRDPRQRARCDRNKKSRQEQAVIGQSGLLNSPCGELINEPRESLPEIVVPACRLRPLPSAVDTPNALGATITQCRLAAARVFQLAAPAREGSRVCRRCALCRQNDCQFSFAQSGKNNLRRKEFPWWVLPGRADIARKNMSR